MSDVIAHEYYIILWGIGHEEPFNGVLVFAGHKTLVPWCGSFQSVQSTKKRLLSVSPVKTCTCHNLTTGHYQNSVCGSLYIYTYVSPLVAPTSVYLSLYSHSTNPGRWRLQANTDRLTPDPIWRRNRKGSWYSEEREGNSFLNG